MVDCIIGNFDDSDARFPGPNAADGRVDDHFQTTLERETARVLMKMTAKDLFNAWRNTNEGDMKGRECSAMYKMWLPKVKSTVPRAYTTEPRGTIWFRLGRRRAYFGPTSSVIWTHR